MQCWILQSGDVQRTDDAAVVREAHAAGQRLWLDLHERTETDAALLLDTFGIHPLIVEDIWLDPSIPKIEQFDSYMYLAMHGIREGSRPSRLDMYVLDLVLSPAFVITQHTKVPASVEERFGQTARLLLKGPSWLAHSLLDRLIDPYLPLLEDLSKQADALELEVLKKTGLPDDKTLLTELYDLRRSLQSLCRITAHQRDALGQLAHGTFRQIPTDALPYFRDVHDHFVRASDQVDTYREVVNTTMEAFLALQSNRMNATMKTLATISTIMLPLSFIASVYGMNFRYMPELEWRYGYPFAITLMVLVGTSLVLWFKKRRWL